MTLSTRERRELQRQAGANALLRIGWRVCSPGTQGAHYKVTDRVEATVLAWTTQRKPADGSTRWSSRKLAEELGSISHMTVTRIWAKYDLRPHRLEGYLASNHLDVEVKAVGVIGLYLHTPQHAALFCVD